MSLSNDFFEYILDQLSPWGEVYKKRMFGVTGLYREGLMFGIIANDIVYLKVDDSTKSKFLQADSKPLKLFKNKTEVPSYYELPTEVLENSEKFIQWAQESFVIQENKNS